jgi:hypothetical protein
VYLVSDVSGDRVVEEYVDISYKFTSAALSAKLPAGTWVLVTTVVDLAGKQVQVLYDGVVVGTMLLTHAPATPPPMTLAFGLSYAEPASAAVTVDLDDVVVQ